MKPDYEFIPVSPNPALDQLNIWSHPEHDTKYSVGVDAATGVGQDYSSIQVFSNRMPFEQVAWYHSNRCTTVEGSRIMVDLASFYNKATLVIETRYPGNAYQDNAIEVYGYANCYQMEKHLEEDTSPAKKYGICTTEADKHLLVNEMKALIEHRDAEGNYCYSDKIIFHDPFTMRAFIDFVYIEDKQKMGASEGNIDDPAMAAMLAVHNCVMYPQAPRPKGKPKILTLGEAQREHLAKRHFDGIFTKNKKGGLVTV